MSWPERMRSTASWTVRIVAIIRSSKTPGQASVSRTCDSRASRCRAWAIRRSSTSAPRCSSSSWLSARISSADLGRRGPAPRVAGTGGTPSSSSSRPTCRQRTSSAVRSANTRTVGSGRRRRRGREPVGGCSVSPGEPRLGLIVGRVLTDRRPHPDRSGPWRRRLHRPGRG